MFGIIRSSPSPSPSPSPSSVELLELERTTPSKLLKDDSLSIFESTLMKLKQGSQRISTSDLNSSPVNRDLMDFESSTNTLQNLSMTPGLTVFSCSSDGSSASVPSTPNQEQERVKGISIKYLFSRYAALHKKQGLGLSNDGSPTNVAATCSSDSQSTLLIDSSDVDTE